MGYAQGRLPVANVVFDEFETACSLERIRQASPEHRRVALTTIRLGVT
jgi:hypothetical protein